MSSADHGRSNPPACGYCGGAARLRPGASVYPRHPYLRQRWYWVCTPCDARVGCHPPGGNAGDGTRPLGALANRETRSARMGAHAVFDLIWRSGLLSRREAYAALSRELGVGAGQVHIGESDVETCARIVSASRTILGRLQAEQRGCRGHSA